MPLEGAPRILGFLYGIILTVVEPYLLYKSRFPVRVRIVFLTGSLLSGILLFAPMTPLFFPASLYQMKEFDAAIPVIIAVFSFFVIATLALGRSFCGYACPIGAIQELPYFIPIKKWKFRQ